MPTVQAVHVNNTTTLPPVPFTTLQPIPIVITYNLHYPYV